MCAEVCDAVYKCMCGSQVGIPRGLIELDLQLIHHTLLSFHSLKAESHTQMPEYLRYFVPRTFLGYETRM